VTGDTTQSSADAQAKRLERVYDEVAKLVRAPGAAPRLRTPPAVNEWSAMQTLGHMTEMIPYWLNHCRTLIEDTGPRPTFGRTHGSPERLAGVAQGASADPDVLLRRLHEEARTAASAIRQMSIAERSKRGISTERGEMTVGDVIESFIVGHAEEHLGQVRAALLG